MSYPQLLTAQEKLADARKRLGIPPIVCICGSTRFMAEMAEAARQETVAKPVGRIVIKPDCNMKESHPLWDSLADAALLKPRLDELHKAKIRMADEVLVVGDYVGDSTRAEIAYARQLGKPIRFTHPEVDPEEPTAVEAYPPRERWIIEAFDPFLDGGMWAPVIGPRDTRPEAEEAMARRQARHPDVRHRLVCERTTSTVHGEEAGR